MENVLIVSSSKNVSDVLKKFIKETFKCNVRTAATASEARGIVSGSQAWELVMVNVPLTDERGTELAEYITENTPACCIVMIKAESAEKIIDWADKSNVIVAAKPFSRQVLYQIVKAVEIAVRRTWSLYQETVRLERQISDIKLVDKAKFQLMQYKNMTEEEAHYYIEQYAMKKRKKKAVAASEIIEKINE